MQKLVMHAVFQALLQLAKIVMSVEVDAWGAVSDEGLAKGAGKGCYEGVCCLTAVCGYDVGVGSMAERPNALVLKTSVGKLTAGSNPAASANCFGDYAKILRKFSSGTGLF